MSFSERAVDKRRRPGVRAPHGAGPVHSPQGRVRRHVPPGDPQGRPACPRGHRGTAPLGRPQRRGAGIRARYPTSPATCAAAVTAALPASEGGTARDAESASADVAFPGALAALLTGNAPAYQFLMAQLPDGPQRRYLLAAEIEEAGQPADRRVQAWTRVLEAPGDDAIAVQAIAALARLGQWPQQAEEMHDRGVLPDDAYQMLRAIWQYHAGDPATGPGQAPRARGRLRPCRRRAGQPDRAARWLGGGGRGMRAAAAQVACPAAHAAAAGPARQERQPQPGGRTSAAGSSRPVIPGQRAA